MSIAVPSYDYTPLPTRVGKRTAPLLDHLDDGEAKRQKLAVAGDEQVEAEFDPRAAETAPLLKAVEPILVWMEKLIAAEKGKKEAEEAAKKKMEEKEKEHESALSKKGEELTEAGAEIESLTSRCAAEKNRADQLELAATAALEEKEQCHQRTLSEQASVLAQAKEEFDGATARFTAEANRADLAEQEVRRLLDAGAQEIAQKDLQVADAHRAQADAEQAAAQARVAQDVIQGNALAYKNQVAEEIRQMREAYDQEKARADRLLTEKSQGSPDERELNQLRDLKRQGQLFFLDSKGQDEGATDLHDSGMVLDDEESGHDGAGSPEVPGYEEELSEMLVASSLDEKDDIDDDGDGDDNSDDDDDDDDDAESLPDWIE